MKALKIILAVLAAAIIAFAVTCPNEKSHNKAIMDVVTSKISHTFNNQDIASLIGAAVTSSVITEFINEHFVFKNYILFSLGQIEVDNTRITISAGYLGHISCITEEQLDKILATPVDTTSCTQTK